MDRLEQASRSVPAEVKAEPPPGPPPLPRGPAHLLAELHPRPSPEPILPPVDEIAEARVEVAPVVAAPRSRARERVFGALVLLAAGLGLVAAYLSAELAPPPPVEVDEALAEQRARAAEARAALESGHRLVLEGPAQADAALAAYRRALAAEPQLAAAERGMAIAWTAKGDKREAVAHYRRYLELHPTAKDAPEVRRIIADYEATQR